MASNLRAQMLEIVAQLRTGAEHYQVLLDAIEKADVGKNAEIRKAQLVDMVNRMRQTSQALEAKFKKSL
jgi:hypothetical protein